MILHADHPAGTEDGAVRRVLRRSLAAGVITVVLVVAGGVGWLVTRPPPPWSATSALLVLPSSKLDRAAAPSFYETLGQGQIVQTYAQILRPALARRDAAGPLAGQPANVSPSVTAVPNTSVINIKVTAPDRGRAERVARACADAAVSTLNRLSTPFQVTVIDTGAARRSGTGVPALLAVVILVSLVAGVGAQQVVWLLAGSAGRYAGSAGAARPADQTLNGGGSGPADAGGQGELAGRAARTEAEPSAGR